MNYFVIVTSGLAGAVLGAFYFGTLWATVRKLPSVGRPYQLLVVSFLVRVCVVMLGFFVVSQEGVQSLFACLAGFWIARFVSVRFVGRPDRGVVALMASQKGSSSAG